MVSQLSTSQRATSNRVRPDADRGCEPPTHATLDTTLGWSAAAAHDRSKVLALRGAGQHASARLLTVSQLSTCHSGQPAIACDQTLSAAEPPTHATLDTTLGWSAAAVHATEVRCLRYVALGSTPRPVY